MEVAPSPLDVIMAEIDRALEAGFFYLAVTATLTLPDICVSLTDGDDRAFRGKRYAKWCDDNLSPHFAWVTGNDLWSLRCGASHGGRFGDLDHNVARVLFSLPFKGNPWVNCRVNDAYLYSVEDFCRNFIADVRKWYGTYKDEESVSRNLDRMVQYRPRGLSPYMSGVPLLA